MLGDVMRRRQGRKEVVRILYKSVLRVRAWLGTIGCKTYIDKRLDMITVSKEVLETCPFGTQNQPQNT